MSALAVLLVYGYSFFWGLRKGSLVCATVCAPGLIPYSAERKLTWREGLKVGLIFNLPRIILLTLIGAAIGYASFALLNEPWFHGLIGGVGILGYVVVGAILLLYGIYTFAQTIEEREDIREGKPPRECRREAEKGVMPHSRLAFWAAKKGSSARGNSFLLIWGGVLGLACVGETIIAIEAALLGVVGATFAGTAGGAALFGASVMFVFAVGAAIPILIVTMGSGELSRRIESREKLLSIKTMSAVAMIMVGLALVLMFGVRLARYGLG